MRKNLLRYLQTIKLKKTDPVLREIKILAFYLKNVNLYATLVHYKV